MRIKKIIGIIYNKLFLINDTPHKVALGLGLGVFSGIFPGTGPIAALVLALFFRANRAAALLGSIFTNTWLSIVTFLLSVKVGSIITGAKWQDIHREWAQFLNNLNWLSLFKLSVLKIILPVVIGYFVIALSLGIGVYILSLFIIKMIKRPRA